MREIEFGRELGLPITVHVDLPGFGHNDVGRLHEAGALGPDLALLHGSTLTDGEIDLAMAAGCRFVDSSPLDVLMGIGPAVTGKLLRHGVRPGISADTSIANPTDLFWVMRAIALLERARAFQATFDRDSEPVDSHLNAHQLLEMATMGGAEAVWMGDQIGSLTPGKLADIVLIRASDLNMRPINDIEANVVYCAGRGNVDSVMVNGKFVKRGGRMISVDQERVLALADDARNKVYERAADRGYVPEWRRVGALAVRP